MNTNRYQASSWEVWIYLALLTGVDIWIFRISWIAGLVGLLVLCVLALAQRRVLMIRRQRAAQLEQDLFTQMEDSASLARSYLPLPFASLDAAGRIRWCNAAYDKMFPNQALLHADVLELLPGLELPAENQTQLETELDGRHFRVITMLTQPGGPYLQFWEDISTRMALQRQIHDGRPVCALMILDNFDQALSATEASQRPGLNAQAQQAVNAWVHAFNGVILWLERERAIAFFENRMLPKVLASRPELLSTLGHIQTGNLIALTMSIGVCQGEQVSEAYSGAVWAAELALERGGDQMVLKDIHGELSFHGGQAHATDRHTAVKSRMMAQRLVKLMEAASSVIVMSHIEPDLDSLGAEAGLAVCARHLNKPIFILRHPDESQSGMMAEQLMQDAFYRDAFITPQQAAAQMDTQTLLIIVDTQNPQIFQAPALVPRAAQLMVLDHHRRGANGLEQVTMSYLEPSAAAASEMLAQMLPYIGQAVRISEVEAECMLAGIMLDTKGFLVGAGVRTYQAASFLRQYCSRSQNMRKLFQDDLSTYTARAQIVANAVVGPPGVAISQYDQAENAAVIAAQAADSLINIRGIHTSLVLYPRHDGIAVSARSLERVNVQRVLERMGGGGHFSAAGAFMPATSLAEANNRVRAALEAYMKEEGL